MSVPFPRVFDPLLEGSAQVMSRSWVRWLREFWSEFGYANDTPIYATASVSLALNNPSGVDTDDRAAIVLPNNYKNGTDLELFFDWVTNDTNTGNVRWLISYEFGDSVLAGTTTVTSTSAASGTSKDITRINVATLSGSGLKRDSYVSLAVTREGTHAGDTYAGTATSLSIGVKYKTEGIGDRKAYP